MKLGAADHGKLSSKVMSYAHGTTASYGGDFQDGLVAMAHCHFAMHAAALIKDGIGLDEAIVDITKAVARHYPEIYREAARRLTAGSA